MTDTPADETASTQTSVHACDHCDSGEDHSHIGERSAVLTYRSALRGANIARALLAAAVLVTGLILAASGVAGGLIAWVFATSVGVMVLSLSRRRLNTEQAMLMASLVSAAAAPLLALGVSHFVGTGWPIAVGAAAGWLFPAAITEVLRNHSLARVLVAHTREGEAARSVTASGRPTSPWVEWTWSVVTAVLFGAWVWATGALPIVVVTLVPLQVALAALSRKLTHRRA